MVSQTHPETVQIYAYFVHLRCYIFATSSVKISILLFYRRLSSNFNRLFFVATWIGIAYNIAYLVTFLFVIGLSCQPIKAYWLQLDPVWHLTHHFTCTDEHISLPTSASLSVVGDFYATMLPCILILKLDLPRRQKLALYSLFLLGFLVVAAGIVRTYFINYLINETYDNTWYLWKFWIWTLVELYISIIAASAPALKPFFRRFLVDPLTSRRGGSSSYARDHKAQSREEREVQRKLWSNASSTMPLGVNSDVEKIGMAVGGDGTRKYELRTLPSGKVEPVQITVGPQKSFDLQSDSQSSSLYPNEHSEWALPPTGPSDDSCPLRTYRAEIESLPPIPGPGRTAPVVGFVSGSRSVTPNRQMRSGSRQGHSTSIPRYSSQSNVRGGAERDRSQDLVRRSSQGSVKAARLRAESLRKADAEAAAARRAAARRSGQDPDDSDIEYDASETSSSKETLQLPKQGSVDRDSGAYDDKSLNLPRQGIFDDDTFRRSKVGLAK
jgi:hypothetical protein